MGVKGEKEGGRIMNVRIEVDGRLTAMNWEDDLSPLTVGSVMLPFSA